MNEEEEEEEEQQQQQQQQEKLPVMGILSTKAYETYTIHIIITLMQLII